MPLGGVSLVPPYFRAAGVGAAPELPPGSYIFQPGGEMHGDACVGAEACIILLQQSVAADFVPRQ